MDDSRLVNVNQLQQLLKGAQGLDLSLRDASIIDKYRFLDQTIDRLNYRRLPKKHKRIILSYLKKVLGYKRSQLTRLVTRAIAGRLSRRRYHRIKSHRIYTSADIKLLEETDEYHLRLSAPATKEILRRETEVFGHG